MSLVRRARNVARRRLPDRAKSLLRAIVPAAFLEFGRPIRRFDLRMPTPPGGLGPRVRPRARPPRVRIESPIRSYVPRLLDEGGVRSYEPATLAAFLAAISALDLAEAFDIGANIGIFSIVGAATTTARITGFEPTPALAENFRDIVQRNDLSCTVEELALGEAPGTATLYLSSVTDSSNSMRSGFRPAMGAVEVTVERVDDYVARTGRVPGLLKIDTETTEPAVLIGATATMAEHRPWVICEILAGRTEAELEPLFRALGYRFHRLRSDGPPLEQDGIEGDPAHLERDWLFTPAPLPAAFLAHYAAWFTTLRSTRR